MIPRASDYIGRRRDSVWERDLAKQLRKVNESDRLEFIIGLIMVNEVVGLEMARRCLADPKSFEKIMLVGLNRADASSMEWWLKAVTNGLGRRRLVAILNRECDRYPLRVQFASYFIGGITNLPSGTSGPHS